MKLTPELRAYRKIERALRPVFEKLDRAHLDDHARKFPGTPGNDLSLTARKQVEIIDALAELAATRTPDRKSDGGA